MRRPLPTLLFLALPLTAQEAVFEGVAFALRHPAEVEVTHTSDGRAYFVEARRAGAEADIAVPLVQLTLVPGLELGPADLATALARNVAARLEAMGLEAGPARATERRLLGETRGGHLTVFERDGARAREVEVHAFEHGGQAVGVVTAVDMLDADATFAAIASILGSLETRSFADDARRGHLAAGARLSVPWRTPMARAVHHHGEILTFAFPGGRIELAAQATPDPAAATASLAQTSLEQELAVSARLDPLGARVSERRAVDRWHRGSLLHGQRFTIVHPGGGEQEVRSYYVPVGATAVTVTATLSPDHRSAVMDEVDALLDSLRPGIGEPRPPPEPARALGRGLSLAHPPGLQLDVVEREGRVLLLLSRSGEVRATETHYWIALRGGGAGPALAVGEELDAAVSRAIPGATMLGQDPTAATLLGTEAAGAERMHRGANGVLHAASAVAIPFGGGALVAGRLGAEADRVDDARTLQHLLQGLTAGPDGLTAIEREGLQFELHLGQAMLVQDHLGERARDQLFTPSVELEVLHQPGLVPAGGTWAELLLGEAQRLAQLDAGRRTTRGQEFGPAIHAARDLDGAPVCSWRRRVVDEAGAAWSGAWVLGRNSGTATVRATWRGLDGALLIEALLDGMTVQGEPPLRTRTLHHGPLAVTVPPMFEPAARAVADGFALEVAPHGSRDCALWIEVRPADGRPAPEALLEAADALAARWGDAPVERAGTQHAIGGRVIPGLRLSADTEPRERAELFVHDRDDARWIVSWSGKEAALADAGPALAQVAEGLGVSDRRRHRPVDTSALREAREFANEHLVFEHGADMQVNAAVKTRPELTLADGSVEIAIDFDSFAVDPATTAFGRMRHGVATLEAEGLVTERYILRRTLLGREVEGQVAVAGEGADRRELHVYASTDGDQSVAVEAWIGTGPGASGPAHLELVLSSLRFPGG